MSDGATYSIEPVLDADTAAQVRELVARAEQRDGVSPISEHQLLRVSATDQSAPWRHVIARASDGTLAGYAIVDPSGDDPEAEIVVNPDHRRGGVGHGLIRQIREIAGGRPALVWSHGTSDGSQLFAAQQHAEATRILWQLRRPSSPLPDSEPSSSVRIRAFEPGDEQRWVELNAAAFAHHPEQGSWTLDDLRAREREPWFDPAGFLIAEATDQGAGGVPAGDIAGFHWTKIHGPSTEQLAADPSLAREALGEVYVVGVDPRAQGLGLGKALTIAGVAHLQDLGIPEVLLYVDDSNTAAVEMYRALGFSEFSRDTQYRLT
ncbi:mycothiol synthase [Epidermidibacterium keratini]|uniref:Mycothiol acetyltransferase n=1 Tax=Epidermidibacterium keratini TaxID=1891644 RepID=A0A7L4YLU0_9ACTN|nr:mycothiol synthase [Epidermidibacterium keratini]QHB99842.1 mycothiol synthase [Epidermidibacterium keratini]